VESYIYVLTGRQELSDLLQEEDGAWGNSPELCFEPFG
jgi:hypothetical protein